MGPYFIGGDKLDAVAAQGNATAAKLDAVAAQGNATATKLDALAAESSAHTVAIRGLTHKVDNLAADLSAHRADTEAHHSVYRVKEP